MKMVTRITNHKTDGEIGELFNHHVGNAIGWVPPKLVNHEMKSAAPCLKQVVNHDLKDCANSDELAKVLGVFKYPGRVLGATMPNDIVQLHPSLKENWDWIQDHYSRIGLPFSREIIWDDDFKILKDFPDYELSVFFFGKRAHSARPDQKWYQIVKQMNSKNNFIKLCQDLKIKTPKTFCYNSKEKIENLSFYRFPVFLKIAESVSGLGVAECQNEQELEKELSYLEEDVSFQVQEKLEARSFINVQYRVLNGYFERVAITEQILDGCQHAGNRFPVSEANPWRVTDPLAQVLYQKGIKGYFAFDLIVTLKNEYIPIECNPRFNGSTYPTLIAFKLGIKSWEAKSFKTSFNKLNKLELGDIEYSPKRKEGVIVYNWGCVSDRKIGVLIAGSFQKIKKYETKLKNILA